MFVSQSRIGRIENRYEWLNREIKQSKRSYRIERISMCIWHTRRMILQESKTIKQSKIKKISTKL